MTTDFQMTGIVEEKSEILDWSTGYLSQGFEEG
jgi:hypothetical protein